MARKSKIGSRNVGYVAPKKDEFRRNWGSYSIAKIHSVHEDLGVVVGLLDEHTTGAIPIEWFVQHDEVWRPNGLACPYVYDSIRRKWAIDKYEEIKEQIKKENEDEKE